ncbi:MAG TPA: hypothetical protein VHY32_04755, partial [Caulobacteraceae bacterium]|nr:hypothetical protein [Caulobacteraceae bacterium]
HHRQGKRRNCRFRPHEPPGSTCLKRPAIEGFSKPRTHAEDELKPSAIGDFRPEQQLLDRCGHYLMSLFCIISIISILKIVSIGHCLIVFKENAQMQVLERGGRGAAANQITMTLYRILW